MLGRDGMGADTCEDDFIAWVQYVTERLGAVLGYAVDVDERGERDVQSDAATGTDEEKEAILQVKESLWQDWCAAGAPGVPVSRR